MITPRDAPENRCLAIRTRARSSARACALAMRCLSDGARRITVVGATLLVVIFSSASELATSVGDDVFD